MSDTPYWWISWWSDLARDFELHYPWWVSGEDCEGRMSVCAAVVAKTEEAAKEIVLSSYDEPPGEIEWRFCERRDGSPFTDRFPKPGWAMWPPVECGK
jgi:hypothetical protein